MVIMRTPCIPCFVVLQELTERLLQMAKAIRGDHISYPGSPCHTEIEKEQEKKMSKSTS